MTKHVLFTLAAGLLTSASFAQTTLVLQPDAAAGKDAEIFSCVPCGYNTRNFGTKQDFDAIAWTNGGNQSNVRSLLQFDLSGIPTNAVISSATLALYFNPTSQEGKHAQIFNTNSSFISRITSAWNETTVTWANQPSTTTTNRVSLGGTTSSTQSFTNINIKQLIIDSRNNPATSFGFMLKLQQEKSFRKLIFASSDHPTASIRPKLTIVYTIPSPLVGGTTTTVAPRAITLFPNPVKGGHTTVSFTSAQQETVTLTTFDALGKVVYSEQQQAAEGYNELDLNISTLPAGLYMVNVKANDKTYTQRLIVE